MYVASDGCELHFRYSRGALTIPSHLCAGCAKKHENWGSLTGHRGLSAILSKRPRRGCQTWLQAPNRAAKSQAGYLFLY